MAAPAQTALPERTNDFLFMDGTQKFGLGVMVETRNSPLGRSEGSFAWAGIFNTYFWVDSKADIMAVLLMQLKPFADPHCVDILRAFEMAVYDVGTF
jgi:methyl acetate hydrolase